MVRTRWKNRARRTMVWVLPLLVTAAVSSPAQADVSVPEVAVTEITPAARAQAQAYWTPERMHRTGADSSQRPEIVGRPWTGRPPNGVGRLFLVVTNGAQGPSFDEWCTATAVPSPNRDVVVTAAHCVWPGYTRNDEVIEVSNVVFVPAYADGVQPHGVFAARAYLMATSYQQQNSPDIAMIVLDPTDGRHVAEATGTQDITFSAITAGPTSIFGYPGSREARGQVLQVCDVPAEQDGNPDRWRTTCDMAGGSSGGPWLADFQPQTGTGTIFSVTSVGEVDFDEETGELFTTDLSGPKLGADASAVYQEAGTR